MNPAHLHLIVNHSGLLYTLLGFMIFSYALWTHKSSVRKLGLIILILGSIGGVLSNLTGEATESYIKNNPHFQTESKIAAISVHEEIGELILPSSLILGTLCFLLLISKIPHTGLAMIIFITIFFNITLFVYAGISGGNINHPETFEK